MLHSKPNKQKVRSKKKMGIDVQAKSTIPNDPYRKNVKWDLVEIEKWKEIFQLLNLNLSILYDQLITYWSVDQVETMYEEMKSMIETPWKWCCEEEITLLKDDIQKLVYLFKEYVELELKFFIYKKQDR